MRVTHASVPSLDTSPCSLVQHHSVGQSPVSTVKVVKLDPCPECVKARTRVVSTRTLRNGTRKRWLRCPECGFRWAAVSGPLPSPKAKPFFSRRGLSELDIKHILLSSESPKKLALRYKCSRQSISSILLGHTFPELHPDIPRRVPSRSKPRVLSGPACTCCIHWSKESCTFDFPEAATDLMFAKDCHLYQET